MTLHTLSSGDLNLLRRNFTKHPKLAQLYFHCCSGDPATYVWNDEKLEGPGSNKVVERLKCELDSPVGADAVKRCRVKVAGSSRDAGDLWACAACCELLNTIEDTTCARDPRQNPFSIASGHDYGRPGTLPELNDVPSKCISPVPGVRKWLWTMDGGAKILVPSIMGL
ncbi:hypothetical protein JG688_00014183 [Phytophthora aleatoria]|uniref:Uncharacterized protein n=1 Tax=Phytophthora aleatoria TaxID=2496075 RepID=A0A8J5IVY1_9STRA|nr:hypothetical protein JG688_00014183 [Phytophthora aleatoria]